MTLRNLRPEEEAVFDAIKQQREENSSPDGCFIYNIEKGDEILRHNGNASKYGIGYGEQHAIIRKLAADGIINADWIIGGDWSKLSFKFAYHDTQEMWDRYSSFLMDIECENKSRNAYFIKLEFSRIREINETCRAKYKCTLAYDKKQCRFVVRHRKEKLVIKRLGEGGLPFEVLKIAVKRHTETITRSDLNKSSNSKVHIGKKSIATRVFDRNSVVRNELKSFVRLSSDGICVTLTAQLTLTQLNKIREICY